MVDQATQRIAKPRLQAFRDRFAGEIIEPGDETYDESRSVWNGMIDRRPALIVRPTTTAEVAAAVRFGRDEDLRIAVRSGGHSLPGLSTCDDGLVIDLAAMRGVAVDADRRTARVDGGAKLGDLDDAAQAVGLACTAGTVSHTGVAGLTLGGGMGRLQRKLGLAIDCLRAVELVTADGRHLRASGDEHPDLFWGVRGAGPNFGIVTAFEFDLAPVGPTIGRGLLIYPATRAREVAQVFREFGPTGPDDLFASMLIGRAEADDEMPASMVGEPIAILNLAYSGSEADQARDLAPLLSLGDPIAGQVRRVPYLESQHANDAFLGWGRRAYAKSAFLSDLPDALVDRLVDHVVTAPPGEDMFSIWSFGGAIARVPEDATAFPGRQAPIWIGAEAVWDVADDDADHLRWARAGMEMVEPWRVTGRYVNDLTDQGDEATIRDVYGDAKYDRLVALKRAWDPDNVFRLNANIRP
jgi:FAD/FMN-containing dehydrogenase